MNRKGAAASTITFVEMLSLSFEVSSVEAIGPSTLGLAVRSIDSNWDAIADMDLNEVINIVDVSKVAKEFGKEWVR